MAARPLCLHYFGIDSPLSCDASQLEAWRDAGHPLTFDDAHVSVLDAAEVVDDALLFVPTAYVGTSDDFLDWDQLRAIRDAGWRIGAHSHTHPRMSWRLYDEDDAAMRARLDVECARSRELLELELRVEVRDFAYPYGEITPMAREAVARAGYERAFVVGEGTPGDALAIGRDDPLSVAPRSAEPVGISVVVPAFERVAILAEVVRRLVSQSYPEDRHEILVVDDGSATPLETYFPEPVPNLRFLRSGDASFRAGQARQLGADAARFEILAFLDADVCVDRDFLWHLDWVHRRTEDCVLLGYLSGYNLHDMGFVHTLDDVRGRSLEEVPRIPDRSREPVLRRCLDNVDWLEAPWTLCYTGNLSLPKALLERVGGFADEFRGWGLEDVDLGYRLHRGGARHRFSRFALGVHLSDPDEDAPRNPFRKTAPEREDFAGYLRNLETLGARHPAPEMQAFVARSLSDVEETCARPPTVGIELGGAASVRGRYHGVMHRVQPGGIPAHELFERVAYAEKVRAKTVYLLGGAVAEHDAFLDLVMRAKRGGLWVSMQSLVFPFASEGLLDAARGAGLDGVLALVDCFDEEAYDAIHGAGSWAAFAAGWDALCRSEVELSARILVSPESAKVLDATLEALDGVKLEEVCAIDERCAELARERGLDVVPAAP